jgi:dTDP-4-dehydrorhamnose 3,5-epimerase
MQVLAPLSDVKLLKPKRFGDSRGWFAEVFNQSIFAAAGLPSQFVQDFRLRASSVASTTNSVNPRARSFASSPATSGTSPSTSAAAPPDFGKWAGFHLKALSAADDLQLLWIPEGFAHGFLVLSDTAEVLYKTTNLYYSTGECPILWDEPTLNITWPLQALDGLTPSISPKDAVGKKFAEAELPPAD